MEKNDKKKTEFYNLVKELRTFLNKNMVTVSGSYQVGVALSFVNGFKILISPFRGNSNPTMTVNGLLVIQDKNLETVKKVLSHKPIKSDWNEAFDTLSNILKSFSNEESTKKNASKNYFKLHYYELRNALQENFHLQTSPDKEFFLYGNDEFEPRFHRVKNITFPKKGIQVKIEDDSALLLTDKDGDRYIDLNSSTRNYQTDTHIYIGDVFRYVKTSKDSKVSPRIVSSSKSGKITYLRPVLKKGVDLSTLPKISYKKADKMVFTLKKNSTGIYSLYDKKGEIHIYHPDLLVRILNKEKK